MKESCWILFTFQLTTSHRGRRLIQDDDKMQKHFNSLPHTEVDADLMEKHFAEEVFQLTTSHRGRQNFYAVEVVREAFQLTTSHRGRQYNFEISECQEYFNSLPHTEVDEFEAESQSYENAFQLTTSHRGRLNVF
mgnify:CR=1 FL=1